MQNSSPLSEAPASQDRLACVGAAGAGAPVAAAAVAALWFIEHGEVDVFLVGARAGAVVGARALWFTAGAGQLLPLPAVGADAALVPLAVPAPHCRYRVLGAGDFERLAAHPDGAAALAVAIDGLLGALHQLPLAAPPRGADASVVRYPTEAGQWFELVAGAALLVGQIPFPGAAGVSVPLPQNAWLTLAPGSTLEARPTAAALAGGAAGLHLLMLALLACADAQRKVADAAELGRLQAKALIDRAAMADALDGFVGVLGTTAPLRAVGTDDRVLGACRLIGKVIGMPFRSHGAPADDSAPDPVKQIADASGVRSRVVALKGRWWQSNHGPLLGFTAATDEAYALLPNGRGGYDALDPVAGTRTPVDAAFAATLAPSGTIFFRGLPTRGLTAADIVRFSAFGVKRDLAVVGAIGLAGGLLGMAIPIASGHLFDTVFPAADHVQLVQIVLVLFVAGVVGLLFEATRSFAMLCVEAKAGNDLQAAVWDRVLSLPLPFFRDMSAGDLAMRINGINDIRKALSGTLVSTILSSIFSLFNAGLLFFYSSGLALAALALVAVAVAFNVTVGYLTIRITRQSSALEGEVSGLVFEFLNGIAKLRVTGSEGRAFARWAARFTVQKRLNMRAGSLGNLSGVFGTVFPLLANMALFLLIAAGLRGEQPAAFSTGAFIAFSAAYTMFMSAMLTLMRSGFQLVELVPLFERTRPILATLPEVDQDKAYPGVLTGAIELSNISFAYDPKGPLILDDVSLRVRPGEFVALVGASGSGKSTLLRLLLGFEKPAKGGIYYDGCDIAEADIGSIRRQLGVVLQSGRLIGGDIYKNIVGSTTRLLADAWEAARACGLDADIEAMPMGMHTLVNGGTISGGQRQRILIARAIVNKPRIIFFDEATSALDNRTQATVSASIEKLHATRVVIAHRLSTIMNADRIYVLDKGKLVQSGTYAQLIVQDGLFAELAKRQLA